MTQLKRTNVHWCWWNVVLIFKNLHRYRHLNHYHYLWILYLPWVKLYQLLLQLLVQWNRIRWISLRFKIFSRIKRSFVSNLMMNQFNLQFRCRIIAFQWRNKNLSQIVARIAAVAVAVIVVSQALRENHHN